MCQMQHADSPQRQTVINNRFSGLKRQIPVFTAQIILALKECAGFQLVAVTPIKVVPAFRDIHIESFCKFGVSSNFASVVFVSVLCQRMTLCVVVVFAIHVGLVKKECITSVEKRLRLIDIARKDVLPLRFSALATVKVYIPVSILIPMKIVAVQSRQFVAAQTQILIQLDSSIVVFIRA